MNRQTVILVVTFVTVLIASWLVAYLLFRPSQTAQQEARPSQTATRQTSQATAPDAQPSTPERTRRRDDSIISQIFGPDDGDLPATPPESLKTIVPRIAWRLALAALLAAMLAYRPRKRMLLLQRNPFVAQTQILLAVVASALMMIVGDSAARAFGIFAAASLVRFRTNISDPKEITVLLIGLAIGLATGVGRWELALILSLFMLLLLSILEYYEPAQVTRAMDLKVTTRNTDRTDEVLRSIFRKHRFDTEVRELNREDEDDPLGKIVYHVNVSASISTDQLSNEILKSDPDNIDGIEWQLTKSTSYIYR